MSGLRRIAMSVIFTMSADVAPLKEFTFVKKPGFDQGRISPNILSPIISTRLFFVGCGAGLGEGEVDGVCLCLVASGTFTAGAFAADTLVAGGAAAGGFAAGTAAGTRGDATPGGRGGGDVNSGGAVLSISSIISACWFAMMISWLAIRCSKLSM